jgi:hypothetical protein
VTNNLESNPFEINAVMPSSYLNSTPDNTLPIYPTLITWAGPVGIGDKFRITNASGSVVLLEGVCKATKLAPDGTQYFHIASGTRWSDFIVDVLDSGALLIEYET